MTDAARSRLIERLLEHEQIDAPDTGITPMATFRDSSALWPGDEWRHIISGKKIGDARLTFAEYRFAREPGADTTTPVLFVFDAARREVRVYSDMALADVRTGATGARHEAAAETGAFDRLLDAMAVGDVTGVRALLGDKVAFSHSDGCTLHGPEPVTAEFAQMMGPEGLSLTPLTMVIAGDAIASECALPNGRATAAVYDLDDAGGFAHIRTYM